MSMVEKALSVRVVVPAGASVHRVNPSRSLDFDVEEHRT